MQAFRQHGNRQTCFAPDRGAGEPSVACRAGALARTLMLTALGWGLPGVVCAQDAKDASGLVQSGLEALERGEPDAAQQAFSAAQQLRPGDTRITFDRGCAALAAGEWDVAVEQFQAAAEDAADGSELQSKALYNLGLTRTRRAEAHLPDDPLTADPEQRQVILDDLTAAQERYRECLHVAPDFAPARRNLESVRLWCHQMQEAWHARDLQARAAELPLLQLLEQLRDRQRQMLIRAIRLREAPRRAEWYRQTRAASAEQAQSIDQLPVLTEKLVAAAQAAAASEPADPGNAPAAIDPPDLQWIADLGTRLQERMQDAAEALRQRDLPAAIGSQREALAELQTLFGVVAPVPVLAREGLEQQKQLLETNPAGTPLSEQAAGDERSGEVTSDASANDPTPSPAAAGTTDSVAESDAETLPLEVQVWDQRAIGDLGQTLALKARQELSALPQMTAPTPAPSADSPDDAAADEDARLQAAIRRSLEKAVELAPEIPDRSRQAAESLQASAFSQALPDQERIRDIFREILEQAGQPPQQQPNSDSQDSRDEDSEQSSPSSAPPSEQGSEHDSPDPEDADSAPDEPSESEQPGSSERQDGSEADPRSDENRQRENRAAPGDDEQERLREQAEILLQQVRERQRRHRERQKQIERLLRGRRAVEKDW